MPGERVPKRNKDNVGLKVKREARSVEAVEMKHGCCMPVKPSECACSGCILISTVHLRKRRKGPRDSNKAGLLRLARSFWTNGKNTVSKILHIDKEVHLALWLADHLGLRSRCVVSRKLGNRDSSTILGSLVVVRDQIEIAQSSSNI